MSAKLYFNHNGGFSERHLWIRYPENFAGGGCASSAGDWAESSDPKNSTTEPITVDANSAAASKSLHGGRWV